MVTIAAGWFHNLAGVAKTSATCVPSSNLSQVYDGTPKSVSVTTTPPSLSVKSTYNGSPNAPTVGNYSVIGMIDDQL